MRDDRVLTTTRWTARIVVPVLAVAGVILYGFPADTERLWAWPIKPRMTPLMMGGGYLAGAVFFARAARSERWHEIAVGFVGAAFLSTFLLVATLLHWDLFTHDHPAFWVWVVVYVAAPVALPAVWLANRRHDPRTPDTAGRIVGRPVRAVVGGVGIIQMAIAVVIFVRPSVATSSWPWNLTPLTTRTVAAFLAFVAVVWLAFLVERRWSALRLHVESAALGLVLLGVGALRVPGDLHGGAAAVFGVLLVGAILGLGWLWWAMQAE